jgi:hypothetical protein
MPEGTPIAGLRRETWFQLFKYTVYLLIFTNVVLFLREDYLASPYIFQRGISWAQLPDAYATTVDSAAWLILLLMFELETWVIDDDKMVGKTRWAINLISAVCFILIIKAGWGYFQKYEMLAGFSASAYQSACSAIGNIQSYALDLDKYFALTAQDCTTLQASTLFVHAENSMITSGEILQRMKALALTDVVNAATWLLVVIILQFDVWLQIRGNLTQKLYKVNMIAKAVLYTVLFAAAVYWGYLSALLDFWDAFLWIIAFFFIELNLFQWNEETRADSITTQGATL